MYGIVIGGLLLVGILAISGKAPIQLEKEISDLNQQLQSCQEKVPICDIKDGYWGFEARCDFSDWQVFDKHHYKGLDECEEAYYLWDEIKNCEVIK